MSGTFADYSWPDEPGMWTGMDGVEYDVVISTEQDEVGVTLGAHVNGSTNKSNLENIHIQL